MERVTCALCKLESNKRCVKKNATVKLNKRRNCSFYEEDENKLNFVERKQGWFQLREGYIKEKKRKAAEKAAKKMNDPKHPLTGDLSRFIKSTVSEKGDKTTRRMREK